MTKLKILFLIFFFSINFVCYSQGTIRTELEVNFIPRNEDDSLSMYWLKTMVRETIRFEHYSKDSVELRIEKMRIPIPTFLFQDICISASWKGHEAEKVPYIFEYDTLRFALPDPDCKIVLDYRFESDFVLRTGLNTTSYLVGYIYDWASWYLTCEGMKVDRIRFNIPDSQCFFANLPMRKEGAAVILDPEKIKENNITFFLLAKEFYDFSAFRHKDTEVELYQTKGSDICYALKKYLPGVNSRSYLSKHEKLAKRAVKSVGNLLGFDSPMKISIADKRLTEREKVIWGSTTHISDRETFILIDSTMWYDNSLHHELIHAFDRGLLSINPKSDSTYYFFAESIVEYLSTYLNYKDKKERDLVFNEMILTYSKSKELNSSIFKIVENNLNGGAETGGSYVINQKTPFVIHNFAKEIGEKRFLRIFKEFYRQARANNRVSMSDFESVAKRHGVTDKEWKQFVKYL